jgi:isocitrate lyase
MTVESCRLHNSEIFSGTKQCAQMARKIEIDRATQAERMTTARVNLVIGLVIGIDQLNVVEKLCLPQD